MNAADITARVQRGAALLDGKRPGWWREIDLLSLDIASRCGCIIGQLGGLTKAADRGLAYQVASERLGVGYYDEIPMGFEAAATSGESGFSSRQEAVRSEYAALTAAWRDLIGQRRDDDLAGELATALRERRDAGPAAREGREAWQEPQP
jgi:hypothetical protein